jgi:hypothetical protein
VQHPKPTFSLVLLTLERIIELINEQETGDRVATQNEEEGHELL